MATAARGSRARSSKPGDGNRARTLRRNRDVDRRRPRPGATDRCRVARRGPRPRRAARAGAAAGGSRPARAPRADRAVVDGWRHTDLSTGRGTFVGGRAAPQDPQHGGAHRMPRGFEEPGRFAEPSLYILVSLAAGPRHGYAIMTDVEEI